MTNTPVAYRHALTAHQGARARQEDHAALWQPDKPGRDGETYPLLAVLADGMGGHVSGQIASQIACQEFIAAFRQHEGDPGPRLARALDAANAGIARKIADEPDHNGMGCTLIGAYLDEEGLRWVSVGDSALLLFRDGQLHRLNADHSHGAILDQQAAEGIISEEAAKSDSRRRALRSALTGERVPLQEIHAQVLQLELGDTLIVASDGLLTLEGNEIADAVDQAGAAAHDPKTLAKTLEEGVVGKHLPRQDNTTIIAIRVSESDGERPPVSEPLPAPEADSAPVSARSERTATTVPQTRILGLKAPYFVAVVVLVFLVGFFAS